MKHLKFIVLLIFFCLIPAILISYSFNLFITGEKEDLENQTFKMMENYLNKLSEKIILSKDKSTLCFSIKEDFKGIINNNHDIENVIKKWDKKYPDLFKIVILNEDKKNKYKVFPKSTKYKFNFKKLAKLLKMSSVKKKKKINILRKVERKLVAKSLFGRDPSFLNKVILRKNDFINVKYSGENYELFWTIFENKKSKFKDILLIFINEKKYKKYFKLKSLIKNCLKNNKSKIFDTGYLKKEEKEYKKLNIKSKLVQKIFISENPSPANIKTDNFIYSFIPLMEGKSVDWILYSKKSRKDIFPEENRYRKIFIISLIFFISIFIYFSFLTYYGYINLFISVRVQLILYFLMATLIPLVTALYFGTEHIKSKRKILIQENYKHIEDLIFELDQEKLKELENIRITSIDVLKNIVTPPVIKFINESKFQEGNLVHNNKIRKKWFKKLEKKLKFYVRNRYFNDYTIVDKYGRIIFGKDNCPPAFLEIKFFIPLGLQIISHYNSGKILNNMLNYSDRERDKILRKKKVDLTAGLLQKDQDVIMESIIQKRNKIHRIDFFKHKLMLFSEPVVNENGEAIAVIFITYDLNDLDLHLVRGFISKNNHRENMNIKLYAKRNSPDLSELLIPKKELKNGRFKTFFRRVKLNKEKIITIISEKGQKYLLLGTMLKEVRNYIVIGTMPLKIINEKIENTRKILYIIFLISLLVAIFIGVLISRKFIHPIKSLEEGVRAISEGELDFRMNIDSNDELGALSNTFNKMVGGLQEKERMSRYVSEFVLSEVKSDDEKGSIGELKKATILFTDIRNFTTLSEKYSPSEIVNMLNDYLEVMTKIIQKNGGVIDKFIGDAIMAVFYPDYPPGAKSDERRAVISALQMRSALVKFNEKRRKDGKFEIENGIGINTGEVIKGNIGSRDYRIDLTVIGDNVNIASRLESLSKEGQYSKIIISERTKNEVDSLVNVEKFGDKIVKGKTKSLLLYEIVSLKKKEEYLPWLLSEDVEKRKQGLKLLGVIGDFESIPEILKMLDDKSEEVRNEAAFILQGFSKKREIIVKKMLNVLESEKSPKVKASLIRSIGLIGSDIDKFKLHNFLTDDDTRVRANTIEALCDSEDKIKLIEILEKYSNDENNRIRANALVILWTLGEKIVLDRLIDMTKSNDYLMRASGCWGIGEISTVEKLSKFKIAQKNQEELLQKEFFEFMDRGLNVIHDLLYDENNMVVRNAIKALSKMGNRQSVHKLIEKYHSIDDEEIKMMILSAIDELGSYNVVREMKEKMKG